MAHSWAARGRAEGWEVLEAPEPGTAAQYDLVVWNHLPDSDLATLGNPIPFEIKKGRFTARQVSEIVGRAAGQGLKGIILVSSQPASAATRAELARLSKSSRVIPVLLDESDLSRLHAAEPLADVIKQRLRDFRST